jgi:hypothetical protein
MCIGDKLHSPVARQGQIEVVMSDPSSPKELDDGLEVVGFDQGGTHIKQVDDALHPNGSNFIEMLLKTRIDPAIQPQLDHLLADAIMSGTIDMPFFKGKNPNAVEALTASHVMTQYAIDGRSRFEFTKILAGLGNMITAPLRSGRGGGGGGSSYGDQGGGNFG